MSTIRYFLSITCQAVRPSVRSRSPPCFRPARGVALLLARNPLLPRTLHLPFGCLNMSGTELNFHIGDKVVYPNHGVGVIEQISSRSGGSTVERFYLLHIKASSLKVMVPCNNAGSVGLRRVVKNGEVQKVLGLLSIK